MLNTNKIKGRMAEKGLNQGDIAEKWGVTEATVSRKINNLTPMTLSEAFSLSKILDINRIDFGEYFFTN